MCKRHRLFATLVITIGSLYLAPGFAQAQERLWVQYQDSISQQVCGLIHAAEIELVVLPASGAFVKVSGSDLVLADYVVDASGNVYYGEEPAGFIGFETDADGDRALFWMTLNGHLVSIDAFDASHSESDVLPSNLRNTGCDACAKWDNPAACADDTGDEENVDENDVEDAANAIAGLCGAGSGTAATLSLAMLLTGKTRRLSRRRGIRE